jgi:hypothetical protein
MFQHPFGEPHIVATYHYPQGTVHIASNAYEGITPEENARRIKRTQQVAGEILYNMMVREAERERAKAEAKAAQEQ